MSGEDQVWRSLAKRVARDPRWQILTPGHRDERQLRLLVGPGGAFVVGVHDYPDASVWVDHETVKVDGTARPFLRAAREVAERAGEFVSVGVDFEVRVRPMLVFSRVAHFTMRRVPDDAVVMVNDDLAGWMRSLPLVLLPGQARSVLRAAERAVPGTRASSAS